ncbi:hypothetical protein LX69_00259 [Breznakibacter xylanolyticus]|uniref:Uncharacterized protein n=1 Tax=Breznakibacter xylanolyticus TaxID=990 RepID=A0A2W7PA92_9BACT|nr:hypothetical protein LX69_00259 [Breznakibacter xylanolyticus]
MIFAHGTMLITPIIGHIKNTVKRCNRMTMQHATSLLRMVLHLVKPLKHHRDNKYPGQHDGDMFFQLSQNKR